MRPQIISMFLVFILSISITACSGNKSNNSKLSSSPDSNKVFNTSVPTSLMDNTASDSKTENTKTQTPSEKEIHTVTDEKILNILSSKNKDVIKSLNLSDSDGIKSINGQKFYVPVFHCEKLGILIGFNGADFDSIDKVKKENDTPGFIMPANGTVISFGKNINFRVGDDMKQFEEKFGKGNAGKEGNLKGDKQYCFLTYNISNLSIRFTSLEGDDFKKYDVYISRSQNSPKSNTTNGQIVSANSENLAVKAYKAIMQNKVNFFSPEDKKCIYLNDFLNTGGSGYDCELKVTHFTILDIDGDKTPEAILELSVIGKEYPDFYEVLHYMDGTVYGYIQVFRGFEDLKTDGTFRYSGGACDYGVAKLRFTSNGCERKELGYCESSDGTINELYFINNKPVKEEAFDFFVKEQDEKKGVVWYEFSQKNIETELSIH